MIIKIVIKKKMKKIEEWKEVELKENNFPKLFVIILI